MGEGATVPVETDVLCLPTVVWLQCEQPFAASVPAIESKIHGYRCEIGGFMLWRIAETGAPIPIPLSLCANQYIHRPDTKVKVVD